MYNILPFKNNIIITSPVFAIGVVETNSSRQWSLPIIKFLLYSCFLNGIVANLLEKVEYQKREIVYVWK